MNADNLQLLYAVTSFIWTAKKQDEKRLEAAEMRFMHWTAGYMILDKKRHEHILEELQVEPITYLQ
jgi:hypothetical protein